MSMEMKVTVVGMKASKGQMDNGTKFDSTKAFLLTPLDDRKGTAKGQGVAEHNIGDSTEYDKYKHLPFPFDAVASMDVIVSGANTKVIVTGLKPVSVSPAKQGT